MSAKRTESLSLDRFDLKILSILARDGRITKSRLAEAINLSVSPCWARVRRLEDAGIITGYGAFISTAATLECTPVWVQIELEQHDLAHAGRFEAMIQDVAEVSECVAVGGGIDYLLKIEAASIDHYQRLIDEWLVSDIGIKRYRSYIVTKTIKQGPKGPARIDPA